MKLTDPCDLDRMFFRITLLICGLSWIAIIAVAFFLYWIGYYNGIEEALK